MIQPTSLNGISGTHFDSKNSVLSMGYYLSTNMHKCDIIPVEIRHNLGGDDKMVI